MSKESYRPDGHNPKAHRDLSGVQFKYHYPGAPNQHPTLHTIEALDSQGDYLGHMDWHKKSGKIDNINTKVGMRGLGVASSMYEKAKKLSADTGISSPVHSKHRTDKGDAWAKSVGGDVPPRAKIEYD